ncbi:class I SAM-dependent methyltransferase [Chloroflexota bacterium]
MKPDEKGETIRRYEERLLKYGVSTKTIGWRDKEQQYRRFDILSEIGNLNSCSILDIGCSFGDFYEFLKLRGLNVKYTGYDISSKLLEVAKKRYPEATFEVSDILEQSTKKIFDYVVSSGVFNARLSDNEEFLKAMITRCFELCISGVAINMTSNYVDYHDEGLYYYSPEKVFTFCKTLTKRITLRHDYMPYEFTVYLYKDDSIDERNVFVNNF